MIRNKAGDIKMKEIDEIKERLDSNDEIIDSLVKKNTEMEKQVTQFAKTPCPDYSVAIDTIITGVKEIKQNNKRDEELALLKQVNEKLDKVPQSATKQFRFLLFPETNQGQYYRIVFGRLIPWGIYFMLITYLFLTGSKVIGIYRYNQDVKQSMHYERAWVYLQHCSNKRLQQIMNEAYRQTIEP